jgi:hypothetical protein|tara:strand:+ start:129 stop:590 length:462 start_codon:yes stop_codon:yes gene_type:complete
MAIMYGSLENFNKAKEELVEKYGPLKAESEDYDFNFTEYYTPEMGSGLKKKFLIFEKKVSKKDLIEVKFFITEIEEKFSSNGRTVNIDPGYLSSTELVLATWKGKDFKEQISDKVWVHKVLGFNGSEVEEYFHTFADYKVKKNQAFIIENKPN